MARRSLRGYLAKSNAHVHAKLFEVHVDISRAGPWFPLQQLRVWLEGKPGAAGPGRSTCWSWCSRLAWRILVWLTASPMVDFGTGSSTSSSASRCGHKKPLSWAHASPLRPNPSKAHRTIWLNSLATQSSVAFAQSCGPGKGDATRRRRGCYGKFCNGGTGVFHNGGGSKKQVTSRGIVAAERAKADETRRTAILGLRERNHTPFCFAGCSEFLRSSRSRPSEPSHPAGGVGRDSFLQLAVVAIITNQATDLLLSSARWRCCLIS